MANRYCRSRGQQLVSIESKDENDAIIKGLSKLSRYYYYLLKLHL
jgi:hypothetical protein